MLIIKTLHAPADDDSAAPAGEVVLSAVDDVFNSLADNFEQAGKRAGRCKTSREFGEALKTDNQAAIAEALKPIATLFVDAGLGADRRRREQTEDNWDPDVAGELCQEIAEALRSAR